MLVWMSTRSHEVGPLEMEVLGFFSEEDAMTVSDIQSKLKGQKRDLAYTTVMTVLVRLHQKGFLNREKVGRQFEYSKSVKGNKAGDSLLSRVSDALFRKERLKPILALLDSEEELTRDELVELKKLVNQRISKMGGRS